MATIAVRIKRLAKISFWLGWCKRHPKLIMLICFLLLLKGLDVAYPLQLKQDDAQFARVVLDEHQQPLRTFADENGIWRYPVELTQVSPLYLDALFTYEDRWFWYHPGVNPLSLIRASFQNVTSGRIVSGGSTISMQVARILHPHQRTFAGKFKQILRTMQLEWHLSKEEILTLYLNNAPYGGTIEGVQAASYTYLNKSVDQLTHAEAALLAVLPQAPTRYRPDLHPAAAQQARDKVLNRLAQFDVWTHEHVQDAKLEQIAQTSFEAPQIAPLLARRLLTMAPEQSIIQTTINSDLQLNVEELVAAYMHRLPAKTSAAVLVVENDTSAVKAYLGTANFGDEQRFGYIDMVQATRSPGSTLKPFLYGLAIDDGLIHSQSLLADVPRFWGDYRPTNFSGAFNGPVSTEEALQRSLNMPAVDVLQRYGPNKFVAQLENAGIQLSIPDNKPNLAVILGGAGSNLASLVSMFQSLNNQGKVRPLRYLQSSPLANERQLLTTQSAWVIRKMLSDIPSPDSLRTFAQTTQKQTLAWKTGTSYGYRDSWAIGVNNQYTIGVWLGRPDGTALPGHHGRATAAPLLFKVADLLPSSDIPPMPNGVELADICWPLGTLADEQSKANCQQKRQAWLVNEMVPPTWHNRESDDWRSNLVSVLISSDTGLRATLACDVEKHTKKMALWPRVLEPWLTPSQRSNYVVPALDPRCKGQSVPSLNTLDIVGITDGNIYRQLGTPSNKEKAATANVPSIWLKTHGSSQRNYWYINGKLTYQTAANGTVEHLLTTKGKQQIVVQDSAGNTAAVTITVE